MFEHSPDQTGTEPAPFAYHERAPYHRPNVLVRLLTGASGVAIAVVLSLGFGTWVGAKKPHWFVTALEDVSSVEAEVDGDIDVLDPSTDSPPPAAAAPAGSSAVLPPPSRTCATSASDDTSFDTAANLTSDAVGVFVSKPAAGMAWANVRKASVAFAYLTATDGRGSSEKHFAENWSMLNECGILRGAVHRYRSSRGIEDQARNFIAALSGDMGELPPAIALDGRHRSRRDCEEYIEGLVTLSQTIEAELNIPPVIYTSASFWSDTLQCTADAFTDQRARALSAYPLWLAFDGGTGAVPGHWHRADFTAVGSTASLGKTDLDIETYNGSDSQLVGWVNGLRK